MVEELTVEQTSRFTQAFILYSQDGNIANNQLGSVMQVLGENPTNDELQSMVNELDRLETGHIYLHAFLEWMAKRAKGEENEVREAFHVFDKDGDGYIDASELHQMMASIGMNITNKEVESMIRVADKDGDGKINENEFLEIMIRK